jgi:hypothetical protein
LLTLLLSTSGAHAQQAASGTAASREELITNAQAEKSRNLKPYEPTRAERFLQRFETFTVPRSGFYPAIGSIYPGGGLALGLGYRQLFGDHSRWTVSGQYSIKSYKQFEVVNLSHGHLRGRLNFDLRAGWMDATQVAFYGLGMDNSRDDRSNFRFKETYAGGTVTLRPVRWVVLGAGLTYEDYRLESGLGTAPSVEEVHTTLTAPGLGISPTYVHGEATGGIDWRTSPGYSQTGGYYGATLHDYRDIDDEIAFRRLQADLIQHIPLLRDTWVLSVRGRLNTILGDDLAPYFLLPSLGSGSTLRAFSSGRFRDRHSLLTTAEFRWLPNRLALDMAIFYDAGKVAARREDLDLNGLKSNVGIGVRFHGLVTTPVRIEYAQGNEGWNIVFSTSAAF